MKQNLAAYIGAIHMDTNLTQTNFMVLIKFHSIRLKVHFKRACMVNFLFVQKFAKHLLSSIYFTDEIPSCFSTSKQWNFPVEKYYFFFLLKKNSIGFASMKNIKTCVVNSCHTLKPENMRYSNKCAAFPKRNSITSCF